MASLRKNYAQRYGYSYYAIRRIAQKAGFIGGIQSIPEAKLRELITRHRERLSDGCVWKQDTRTLRMTRLAHRADISPSAILRRLRKQNLRIGELTDSQVVYAVQHDKRAPWGSIKSRKVLTPETAEVRRMRAGVSREPITVHGPDGQSKTLSLGAWARLIGVSDRSIAHYAMRNHGGDRSVTILWYLERARISPWDAETSGSSAPSS